MQYKNELTIELPPFQMEILKRAARFKQVSPEDFVVGQLNLESMESWLGVVIRDAAQGYMGDTRVIRCQRCQYGRVLGIGATLCGTCQYDYPEACSDEVHQRFASLWQSEAGENFHCGACNKWVVMEKPNDAQVLSSETTSSERHAQRQYVVALGETTFNCLRLFVEDVLPEYDKALASEILVRFNSTNCSIGEINGRDLDSLRKRLENYVEECKNQYIPDSCDPETRHNINSFINSASQVIEDIDRSVKDQIKHDEYLNS